MSLIETVRYDALFTFLFSPRRGTPAERMPDPMPKEQKSANFQRLLQRQNEISWEKHQRYVGGIYRCLVDGQGTDGRLTARTDGGRLVHLAGDPGVSGPGRTRGLRRPLPGLCLETWWRGEGVSPHAVGTGGTVPSLAGPYFFEEIGKEHQGEGGSFPLEPHSLVGGTGEGDWSGRGLACGLKDQRLMARPPARAGGRSGLLSGGKVETRTVTLCLLPRGYPATSPARPAGGRAVTGLSM